MSYALCLWHGPVALASSQTKPHFIQLGPRYSTQCFIPDPTSLHLTQPHFVWLGPCISNLMLHPRPNLTSFDLTKQSEVRSLYFKVNAKSQTQPHFVLNILLNASFQTQPHFVWLCPCISNLMLSLRPNLTSFG
ncbi:hypothetical protein E4T56_gene6366 [Termitomyces sp. T112]|nr:hypothetical protein E4T56_gene6366 [Termitomyces sp. T112]